VNLPEVEVIGAQPAQRLLELAHRDPGVAAVRADLRHQEHRIPSVLDGAPHPLFALAVVVLPGVVQKVDPGGDRLVNDPDRLGGRPGLAEVVAAKTDDRDLVGMAAERAAGYELVTRCGVHVVIRWSKCKARSSQTVSWPAGCRSIAR